MPNTLKFTKEDINFDTKITLKSDGFTQIFYGYKIGELPKKFAFIYNEDTEQEGIYDWFNYKGLTFICEHHVSSNM